MGSVHDFSRLPLHPLSLTGLSVPKTKKPSAGFAERARIIANLAPNMSLEPHSDSLADWRNEASIYTRGQTPVHIGGRLAAWNAKPLGASETAADLRQIHKRFGSRGLERSLQGLRHTRGSEFAQNASEQAGFSIDARSLQGGVIGRETADTIQASNPSSVLPAQVRDELAKASGQDVEGIRIHNDAAAHRAADSLNARAFTAGRGIYFAQNEYQPATSEGKQLIAHEVAHAIQQREHESSPNQHSSTSGQDDREEKEAVHFAAFVSGRNASMAPLPLTPSTKAGRLHRAFTFSHANDAIATNPVTTGPNETAAGFKLKSNPGPSFQWTSDVTIHGAAGDPFGNFVVGMLQVERAFWVNVVWGSGTNETHRNVHADHLPRRDAISEPSIFMRDTAPDVAPAFTANGDVRTPTAHDTPATSEIPWDNPIAGRTGSKGWVNYGDAFVTYLSAHDTTAGNGANAFHDIACVYWNLGTGGTFDKAKPLGNRVTLTEPRAVNHGGVIEGGSADFPAMHGGTIANGHDIRTDK